jgi:exopolysaccharide biosynthesis polyprenyl glycosylphosphotransferase
MHITRYNKIVLPLFFLSDLLIMVGLFLFIYWVKNEGFNGFYQNNYNYLLLVNIISWSYLSFEFETFKVKRSLGIKRMFVNLFVAYFFFVAIYFGFIVLMKYYQYSRLFHLTFLLSTAGFLFLASLVRYLLVFYYRSKGRNLLNAVLLYPNDMLFFDKKTYEYEMQKLGYGLRCAVEVHGTEKSEDLWELMENYHAEVAFIIDPSHLHIPLERIVDVCDNLGVRVKLLPGYLKNLGKRLNLDYIDSYPVMDLRNEPLLYLHNRAMKRSVDLGFSLLIIIFFMSWFTLLVWLMQRISGAPGPIFFRQKRIGRDGKDFLIWKYRSMRYDPEKNDAALNGSDEITQKNDPRIFWFGKFLRKTNLDELPQFLNVLKGEMSVVGPRPHMSEEDETLAHHINKYPVRRFVKPGITGWAAIHGYRGGTESIEAMTKRTEYDIHYLENWTLWLDIRIMLVTTWQMLTFRIPNAY